MDINDIEHEELRPHAFHLNLPRQHFYRSEGSKDDRLPYITKFAQEKARNILKLAYSIELKESLYIGNSTLEVEEVEIEDGEGEGDDDLARSNIYTLTSVTKKCTRLQSQLNTLESLKHSGITQRELCQLILHILHLVSTTVTFDYDAHTNHKTKAILHFENVGYIWDSANCDQNLGNIRTSDFKKAGSLEELESELQYTFALPSPAREALLSVLVSIMSKKSPLRAVSNASLELNANVENSFLLILHWEPLLRMLLRTAPYLHEHTWASPPKDSNSRQNTVQKRTVHLLRHARHYFIQDGEVANGRKDATACEIWDIVKRDLITQKHTHAFYRGLIVMYLLMPTRCSSEFYLERMPFWYNCWTNLDRSPEIDFLWLVFFCRARKHLPFDQYDWGPIRRRLLTHSQYWLQIPIGGASMDSSFPRASNPRTRSCPSRLKAFIGSSSSYEDGIDFVAKVAKLLALNIGINPPGTRKLDSVSEGTADILRMLHFVTPYFNPSNIGTWTFTLGAFLHYFSYEVCHRIGVAASVHTLRRLHPNLVEKLLNVEPYLRHVDIPPAELVVLMDALLPLCQQALYSKNGHVGRAGEAALVYLSQIDPVHVTPPFLDFAIQALDISAVNLAHQAPSALSALTRLVQPSLRRQPSILLSRLPELLRLSLAGVDSNDQNKTIRTLILYRNLTSWLPIGSICSSSCMSLEENGKESGCTHLGKDLMRSISAVVTSDEYLSAMKNLPETSVLSQPNMLTDGEDDVTELLIEEANSAMADWVLGFLDRVYDLLRAAGEREKSGKTASGVASRHSSSDVQHARNFSRILKECLWQVFSSMDEEIYSQALQSVTRFLAEETLPSAAKDAAALCQAVCAVRFSDNSRVNKGAQLLFPVLTEDLAHQSNKTLTYRIRCLAGAVRRAGKAVYFHRNDITRALSIALASRDKNVLKMGCKLLRHTLASQSDSYPVITSYAPRSSSVDHSFVLGKSAELIGNEVDWLSPDGEQVDFVYELLQTHVMRPIADLKKNSGDETMQGEINALEETTGNEKLSISSVNGSNLRRCLRIIRYALRGGSGILLDMYDDSNHEPNDETRQGISMIPHEEAVRFLLNASSEESRDGLNKMRKQICAFVVLMMSIIASETMDSETDLGGTASARQNYLARVSSDSKICKEVSEISMLLLTRRGAQFRCQEGKTIWNAQKQLVCDFVISAQTDHMSAIMHRAGLFGNPQFVLYKDGEDGGKTIPRRLLVTRVHLFYESIQRNSSFETPRKLRRLQNKKPNKTSEGKLFNSSTDTNREFTKIDKIFDTSNFSSMDGYEGIMDGLFSLSCHTNTQVRAAGIGVVDYGVTRFGWLVRLRVPRLLAALTLKDDDMKGIYGIPSCFQLSKQLDSQGKRRRMAEVMKGVCSLLSVNRAVKELMGSEKSRLSFVQTLCETDAVISQLPTEEMQKMFHYYQSVFNPFRSKYYSLHRTTEKERITHEKSLFYLLNLLTQDDNEENDESNGDSTAPHWRRRLLVAWFLTCFTDTDDLRANSDHLSTQLWKLCFKLLEDEVGQPLQRMALGLFGRLLSLSTHGLPDEFCSLLIENLRGKKFCQLMTKALVYDHREDSSVGGGHDAQWSAGVEDLIRDAGRNVAPRSLFPFTRTGQSSGVFKVTHAQLVELMVIKVGSDGSKITANFLLDDAKVLAAAPPSEDQRNQHVTSAEVFGGVSRGLLQLHNGERANKIWKCILLPYLEETIPKIPISIAGAYFDAFRYGIQYSDSQSFLALTNWVVENVESSIWQSTGNNESNDDTSTDGNDSSTANVGSEGFTLQSKYLYLASALLVELDAYHHSRDIHPWYTGKLSNAPSYQLGENVEISKSWRLIKEKLLPLLLSSVGHPYENCRDHISGCLFRIHSYKKRQELQMGKKFDDPDVTKMIVSRLASAGDLNGVSLKERYNSLITARKFISYSIYLGDAKSDFNDLILPLLPMCFESLQTTVDAQSEVKDDVDPAIRALEADVFKGYRYTVAEISVSCVLSYGRHEDLSNVLNVVKSASKNRFWQVRQGAAHFLRCFEGCHKFLFTDDQSNVARGIIASLLADERREVSSAAMSALTGILAATPDEKVKVLVDRYVQIANRSRIRKRKNKKDETQQDMTEEERKSKQEKEERRSRNQQASVFFLCAAILAEPYDTPPYVPVAIAAVSKHSFEKSAPLGVRDIIKKCCSEFKRTHMSDNWELHREVFNQEQLEALEDVVSTPHYYA